MEDTPRKENEYTCTELQNWKPIKYRENVVIQAGLNFLELCDISCNYTKTFRNLNKPQPSCVN